MKQLLPEQRALVSSLAERLGAISGIKAVVLGGSHARGRAQPGSDIDLGLFYAEASPFSIQHVCELAEAVNDAANPVVTDFYGWGRWVNGGAWLTIGGQRVDFVYRNLEHVERVIAEAEAGRYELDYAQQPPFGFFSATYLGEVAICVPLFDPAARVERFALALDMGYTSGKFGESRSPQALVQSRSLPVIIFSSLVSRVPVQSRAAIVCLVV
jgi:predicted nucleotidyltransferase